MDFSILDINQSQKQEHAPCITLILVGLQMWLLESPFLSKYLQQSWFAQWSYQGGLYVPGPYAAKAVSGGPVRAWPALFPQYPQYKQGQSKGKVYFCIEPVS